MGDAAMVFHSMAGYSKDMASKGVNEDGSTAPSGGVVKTDKNGHAIKRIDTKKAGK
jgi:hypothetical protein